MVVVLFCVAEHLERNCRCTGAGGRVLEWLLCFVLLHLCLFPRCMLPAQPWQTMNVLLVVPDHSETFSVVPEQ